MNAFKWTALVLSMAVFAGIGCSGANTAGGSNGSGSGSSSGCGSSSSSH